MKFAKLLRTHILQSSSSCYFRGLTRVYKDRCSCHQQIPDSAEKKKVFAAKKISTMMAERCHSKFSN